MLPVVNREVCFGLHEDMNDPIDWVKNYTQHVTDTNPVVAEFLVNFTKGMQEKTAARVAWAGLVVYRMLEAQAECQKLEEIFQ